MASSVSSGPCTHHAGVPAWCQLLTALPSQTGAARPGLLWCALCTCCCHRAGAALLQRGASIVLQLLTGSSEGGPAPLQCACKYRQHAAATDVAAAVAAAAEAQALFSTPKGPSAGGTNRKYLAMASGSHTAKREGRCPPCPLHDCCWQYCCNRGRCVAHNSLSGTGPLVNGLQQGSKQAARCRAVGEMAQVGRGMHPTFQLPAAAMTPHAQSPSCGTLGVPCE